VPHGRVVKGVEFKQIRHAGEPVDLATRYYEEGADKCSTNTAAIHNPDLINEASKVVGSQACVIGIDAKRRYIENPKENNDKFIVETDKGYCGLC
jgi:imidazole glycerol phosphate synthase subunit HisF